MKLKELRKEKNKTQDEMSKILNIARSTYNGYEQNISEPNIDTLCKLADYYNITLDYLVGREFNNDLGYLDDNDKNLIQISKQLSTINKIKLLAFAHGLFEGQK